MRNDHESVPASPSDAAAEPMVRTAWVAPSIEDVSIGGTAAKKKFIGESITLKSGS